MENPITITVAPGTEFILYQLEPASNCYELVFEDGEEFTARELMALNAAGYIYHSSLYDIDYEDEFEGGGLRVGYMDIHYFAKVAEGTFTDCLPE
jgi:hypothetical protein